ncbi:hypothetical protein SVAN01_08069 [Stagonosporopsis vannaccii]|nr:hypothetical protein SVAN01_08069 [Stagonosporopsis vannaccii]
MSAAPPPTLITLPEELLLAILSHITHLPTLAALSITTQRLHRLTLPALYHSFPGRHSELFLRTVSHSPSLASHARTATWQQERKALSPIDVLEKTHIVSQLNQVCVPHGIDLAAEYAQHGRSDEYWWFEMLVLFLPKLEAVRVRESWLWDDHHYWFKSLSTFFNPLAQTRLVRATLDGPLRIENVVPLLTIPSLRELDLSQVIVMRREGYRVFQWSVWPVSKVLPEASSGLEVLRLRESYVDMGLLAPVVRGIKALRVFEYEHMFNDLSEGSHIDNNLEAAALAELLQSQRGSIEHVRVRMCEEAHWDGVPYMVYEIDSAERGKHERDEDFENLQILDLGPMDFSWMAPLTGFAGAVGKLVDHLPKTLKTFRFMALHGGDDLDMFLRGFASALASAQCALKTVEVVDWDPTLGWFPENLLGLQKTYSELGLRLGSVARDVLEIYGAEPLLVDEETEEEWVMVTDLRLASQA